MLYHLTQLTLAATPRTSYSNQVKKKDEHKSVEDTCPDSFEEVRSS